MAFDFTKLTEHQQELLTFGGWNLSDAPTRRQPNPHTVRKLIERGLVKEYTIVHGGLTVRTYEVPLAVHMAWCERCSRKHREEV